MNWSEFFHMGGYGLYVWGSYAFAGIILVVNAVIPIFRSKQVMQMLRELSHLKRGQAE